MSRIPVARTLHDVGLAAWFGGTLMGAVGLNGAAAAVDDPRQTSRVANAGWAKWTPVNAAAIGAHLVGGALIINENSGRIKGQKGVAGWTTAKTVLTGTALAATAAARLAGKKMDKAGDVPTAGATEPLPGATPPEVAKAQRQLKALQWAIPALTGGVLYCNAVMGEQQRPAQVVKGILARAGQAAVAAVEHPQAAARVAAHVLTS